MRIPEQQWWKWYALLKEERASRLQAEDLPDDDDESKSSDSLGAPPWVPPDFFSDEVLSSIPDAYNSLHDIEWKKSGMGSMPSREAVRTSKQLFSDAALPARGLPLPKSVAKWSGAEIRPADEAFLESIKELQAKSENG